MAITPGNIKSLVGLNPSKGGTPPAMPPPVKGAEPEKLKVDPARAKAAAAIAQAEKSVDFTGRVIAARKALLEAEQAVDNAKKELDTVTAEAKKAGVKVA